MHPAGAEPVDAFGVEWAVRHDLFTGDSAAARMNVGLAIAAAMPFTSEEFVKAFTAYCYWTFAWDDHLDTLADDPAALAAHIAEVAFALNASTEAPIAEDRWVRGARASRDLLSRCMSPAGRAAFVETNNYWITGELWKRVMQHRQARPGVGEFIRMRKAKMGMTVLAAMTGPGGGYPMGSRQLSEPPVQAFSEAVLLACSFFNDMVSALKEAPVQKHINIMAALGRDDGLPDDRTNAAAYELYERTVCLALRLQRRLLADPRPEVVRYAAELPQWIPATLHFTATSARYHLPDLPGDILELSDTPLVWDSDDHTPPPHPQIAWWWDHALPHVASAPHPRTTASVRS
ncbi:hypothetical protein BJF79_08045 [Actinomadura sp. CNU-125]|nr:hypothetical protein BJF79_08045 [Actinomadura sp. CNU-125]